MNKTGLLVVEFKFEIKTLVGNIFILNEVQKSGWEYLEFEFVRTMRDPFLGMPSPRN
jgi:hypothetical protein